MNLLRKVLKEEIKEHSMKPLTELYPKSSWMKLNNNKIIYETVQTPYICYMYLSFVVLFDIYI